jgi:hypothetical protein
MNGTPYPTRYSIKGDDRVYLAFRTEQVDGRILLSLIPDMLEQHPFDVATVFLDEPRLHLAPGHTAG